jgi:hypothetical protein
MKTRTRKRGKKAASAAISASMQRGEIVLKINCNKKIKHIFEINVLFLLVVVVNKFCFYYSRQIYSLKNFKKDFLSFIQ